jgi:hypothetical protein
MTNDTASTLPISICEVSTPDGKVAYVTLASPEDAGRRGLVSQEIIGQLLDAQRADDLFAPDNFARNRVFVDFLHEVIRKHGLSVPNLIAAARKQADGWVYIIDGRTPTPEGPVPPEDILGGFEVSQGEVVPDSYRANPNHRLLSQHGFFQLDPVLQARLLDELATYR